MAPPSDRNAGTTWSGKDTVVPTTRTGPVRARAGTTTLRRLPSLLTLPVRVRVPTVPESSAAGVCTSVASVKPRPTKVIHWPALADACVGSAASPTAGVACNPPYSTKGGTAKTEPTVQR